MPMGTLSGTYLSNIPNFVALGFIKIMIGLKLNMPGKYKNKKPLNLLSLPYPFFASVSSIIPIFRDFLPALYLSCILSS